MNVETVWNSISPNYSLFQTWEFRKAWLEGFGYTPHVVHISEGGEQGLLPLWFDQEEQKYMFIGSDWPEDNVFFVTSAQMIPSLIAAAPRPLELTGLVPFEGMDVLSQLGTLEQDPDLKYVLPLPAGMSFESLLSSFPKKHRYNLRYDHRKIMEQNAQIDWVETTDPSYFDQYIKMKEHVFHDGGKDENYYADPRRAAVFKSLISAARQFRVRVLTISIGGRPAGIDIVFLYNGIYYLIGGAYDTMRFSGVGNAALFLLFNDALNQGAKSIDCLQEDDGWKHRYFEGKPLYIFTAP